MRLKYCPYCKNQFSFFVAFGRQKKYCSAICRYEDAKNRYKKNYRRNNKGIKAIIELKEYCHIKGCNSLSECFHNGKTFCLKHFYILQIKIKGRAKFHPAKDLVII